jgi:hypothetical protein
MDSQYIIDRGLLRFADEVKIQFAFLESLGFRCVRSEITLVRFESLDIAICVYHEKLSYEIGSTIESLVGTDTYSFSEILRLVHSERAEKYRDYATHTVEGVAKGVSELAELFQRYVDTRILNDTKFFPDLKQQRDEWARSYAVETQLVQARKKSDISWKEGDFGKVVQILIPLREHLNPSDSKKLEYALKHSNV